MDINQIITALALSAPGFLIAIVIHEWAHGYVAWKFGDDTAYRSGRVTLNPAAHYDLMGTIIFPLLGVLIGFAAVGWARPVPINASKMKPIRQGIFWVSFAGPLSNFVIGFVSAFLFALLSTRFLDWSYTPVLAKMLSYSVMINFFIGAFNLLPLPPLDGARMVSSFLSYEAARRYEEFGQITPYIFLGLMILSFAGIHILSYILFPAQWLVQLSMMFFVQVLS